MTETALNHIHPDFRQDFSLCEETPAPTVIKIQQWGSPVIIKIRKDELFDSISLICDKADGYSYCKSFYTRSYYLMQNNYEINLTASELFEWDSDNYNLIIKR